MVGATARRLCPRGGGRRPCRRGRRLLRRGGRLDARSAEASGAAAVDAVARAGVTGVAAVNDGYAAGLVEALRARRVPVPSRLSVVGADDAFCFRDRDLTTVATPLAEMAEAAVGLLVSRLARAPAPARCERHAVRPRLIPRSSSGRPR